MGSENGKLTRCTGLPLSHNLVLLPWETPASNDINNIPVWRRGFPQLKGSVLTLPKLTLQKKSCKVCTHKGHDTYLPLAQQSRNYRKFLKCSSAVSKVCGTFVHPTIPYFSLRVSLHDVVIKSSHSVSLSVEQS